MKKLFLTVFIGILCFGFISANTCFRNFRCFHFSKHRNMYCENSKTNQQRPRDGRGCPVNGRGKGRHNGECNNPKKGPGYGQGQGRGQGRYRSN